MLRRPLPGFRRRLGGIVFALLLTVSGGYEVWAAQPEAQIESAPILVKLKLTVTDPTSTYMWSAATVYVVNSGEPAPYPPGQYPYDFRCTAFLLDKSRGSSAGEDQKGRGGPLGATGQIVMKCKISNDTEVVSTPSLIALDGEPAAIEIDDPKQTHRYRLELNATTSKEKIEAEKMATAASRH